MTRQTYEELYDDAQRLNPEVVEEMEKYPKDTEYTPWSVEYEIPAETNGWVYYGDCGSLAVTANWGDQFPNPTEGVSVYINPTHPRDDNCDVAQVYHVADIDDKIDSRTMIAEIEGEPYRTPLHVSRKIFWEAVEVAIEWMEENPPQ